MTPAPTHLPSVWRASWVALAMGALAWLIVGWLVASTSGVAAGLAAGALVAAIATLAELQAAWRLRRAIGAFAASLPSEGRVVSESWTSEQTVRWPALGVAVKGRVSSYAVRDIQIDVRGNSLVVRPRDARRAGEDVARSLRSAV